MKYETSINCLTEDHACRAAQFVRAQMPGSEVSVSGENVNISHDERFSGEIFTQGAELLGKKNNEADSNASFNYFNEEE